MTALTDGAYSMAAISTSVVAFRVLVSKGLITREEAVRALLDEAVQRALFAETGLNDGSISKVTADLNRQTAEIIKYIAESL
jgi:hypothetical protein